MRDLCLCSSIFSTLLIKNKDDWLEWFIIYIRDQTKSPTLLMKISESLIQSPFSRRHCNKTKASSISRRIIININYTFVRYYSVRRKRFLLFTYLIHRLDPSENYCWMCSRKEWMRSNYETYFFSVINSENLNVSSIFVRNISHRVNVSREREKKQKLIDRNRSTLI